MDKDVLYIIGMGPGSSKLILPEAYELIESCDVLMGGKRNLEIAAKGNCEKIQIGSNFDIVCDYISKNIGLKKIGVLVTGDPCLYSLTSYLKKKLPHVSMNIVPGISSMQYLCCKLNLPWNDMAITSMHGRHPHDFIEIIRKNHLSAVFAGGGNTPDEICTMLIDNALGEVNVTVGEKLSYEDERIVTATAHEISTMSFDTLSIMIITNENYLKEDTHFDLKVKESLAILSNHHMEQNIINKTNFWNYKTHGIPDEMFLRGDVPMTKQEVRAISLSKLKLSEGHNVYDIGAGTGSVSIECALVCHKGTVVAVEKEAKGVELIKSNSERFGISNIAVLHGSAPQVLSTSGILPLPDRIFIGGTCGNMKSIVEWALSYNRALRIVVNAVTIESVYEAIKAFEELGLEDIEVTSVSVSRGKKAGNKTLMNALNMVYIISAESSMEDLRT